MAHDLSDTKQNLSEPVPLRRAQLPRIPLTDREGDTVARMAQRLDAELTATLTKLGPGARSPRALSRMLAADFKLCQRLLRALKEGGGQPAMMLVNLPGPEGLRAVVNRMVQVVGGQQTNLPVQHAVDQFEQICFEIGGSHAGLGRRLTLPGALGQASTAASQEQSLASRRGIIKHAAEFLGHFVDIQIVLVMIRPIPDDPMHTELVTVTGLIGFESALQAVPLMSHQSLSKDEVEEVAHAVRIRPLGESFGAPSGLIREFTSPNVPISSFEGSDGQCRHVVDVTPGRATDIVLASHSSPDINQRLARGYWTQTVGIRRPTKRLVLDVYLHEQLRSASPPSVATVLWHPGVSNDPKRIASERLPTHPRLELLGTPPARSASAPWRSLPSLTERMFELVNWPMDQFSGYRCDEIAPVWGGLYMMSIDYRDITLDV